MSKDERYMQRCLDLAKLGLGNVAPNPMVGCVIVVNDKIIAEGYHQAFGQPHAEVNAINNVTDEDLLTEATLYVNLEPCAHKGKTPPCSDLIIERNIKKVVIGSSDPNSQVAGKGIEKLRSAGIEVVQDIMKEECIELNKRFFTYHKQSRPYIILKWAQSKDGFIGKQGEQVWLTGNASKQLVHKWRTEEQAILVGFNTAKTDNPELTARLWEGKNPLRLVVDRHAELDENSNLLDGTNPTIVFSEKKKPDKENTEYVLLNNQQPIHEQVLQALQERNVISLIIEGGAITLTSFIESNLWDEARVFTTYKTLDNGIKAPKLGSTSFKTEKVGEDKLEYFYNK